MLDVKKHKKNRGFYFHKMPRVGGSKAKQAANKDISKYCKVNYITREYILMEYINNNTENLSWKC